jgi:hypothetical protein
MADNIGYTPGTGATIAADDIGGVLYQRVKMVHGADGAAVDASAANPLPVSDAALAALNTLLTTIASSIANHNAAFSDGSPGQIMLAKRRDADTTAVADGDLNILNMDEAGRLKVATQPGSVSATTGSITASAQTVSIQTARISNLSIAMAATSLVGHNSVFEVSNDSTNGTDGNWYGVQAVRTNSNVIETSTGVLAATPAYAWELNVAAYQYFRIRSTAHTSGTAAYTLKPAAYATEPVPSSQNPALVQTAYSVAGVIAVNTDLMVIDCLNYKSISIQCTSMGTAGVVTPAWSNDGTTWVTATMLSEAGASSTTFNAAVLRNTNVLARYFRLRLTTATTAGTTTINVQASQAVLAPIVTTQPVSGTVTATVANATANPAVPGTPYFLNSAATTNGALVITGTSNVSSFYATNEGASVAYVKLYNKATAPTVGTDVPEMIIPVTAAVGGVPGVANPNIGFHGFRFALGLGIAITRNAVHTDTTAIGAGEVKVKLSRAI